MVGCDYKNNNVDSSFPNALNIGKPDVSLDTDRQKGEVNEVEGKITNLHPDNHKQTYYLNIVIIIMEINYFKSMHNLNYCLHAYA